jgi:hypothetical protein
MEAVVVVVEVEMEEVVVVVWNQIEIGSCIQNVATVRAG